jgi:GT2 family glycosyltransferase
MGIKTSVIILNWNGTKWLDKCISSILNQDSEAFEVLLVDNGSKDDSVKHVRQRFSQVRIINLDRNYGFAEGNNRALRYARGEYLVFVNMDTEAENGWLENLVKVADEHSEYQILCSIQIPSQLKNRTRALNAFGHPMPNPHESRSAITESLFASGGCFLIRREWLDKLGYLFDPFYFCSAEDLELSLRTILLGGRIGYVRDSRLYHYVGGANFPSARMSYFSMRNVLLTYYKLLDARCFIEIFCAQIIYVSTRFFARKKQLPQVFAMIKGFFGFLSSFNGYIGFRKEFIRKKKRGDEYLFERFLYRGKMENTILKHAVYKC